jgi:hypothetical protein
VNPYPNRQGPAGLDLAPERSSQPRCISKSRFLSEPAGKCNLAGAGRKSWLGMRVEVGGLEFHHPIGIPTTNSHN